MSPCISHVANVPFLCICCIPCAGPLFLCRLHVFKLHTSPWFFLATHFCDVLHVSMLQFDRRMGDYSGPAREPRSRNVGRGQARRSLSPPRVSSRLASTSERPGMNYRDREDSSRSVRSGGDKPFQSHEGGFRSGVGRKTLSACAVCLGRHPHKIVECGSSRTWDQIHPTHACRLNRILTMRDGRPVCHDWQRDASCSASHHDAKHFCSGCNATTHGAQECPRAQRP